MPVEAELPHSGARRVVSITREERMTLFLLAALAACSPGEPDIDDSVGGDTSSGWNWDTGPTDTGPTHTGGTETGTTGGDTSTGWNWDTETGTLPETGPTHTGGTETGTTDTGTTDTGTEPEEPSCQEVLLTAGYPVFPSSDGRNVDTFTMSLTGANRQFATLSWGTEDEDSPGGWWISCGMIAGESAAILDVQATSPFGASTFSVEDPLDGATPDANGLYWYPGQYAEDGTTWETPITGGDLGGTPYEVTGPDASGNTSLDEVVE